MEREYSCFAKVFEGDALERAVLCISAATNRKTVQPIPCKTASTPLMNCPATAAGHQLVPKTSKTKSNGYPVCRMASRTSPAC